MIFLIRHGKAEVFAESDFKRELTIEGKIILREDFEKYKENNKLNNLKIYSSPLVRAVESAEIISNIFNTDFEIIEELSSGGYDQVINKYAIEDRDYFFIGHEPFISDAIKKLTNTSKIVSRGSIHRVR